MKRHEADKLIAAIVGLVEGPAMPARETAAAAGNGQALAKPVPVTDGRMMQVIDEDALYHRFKRRFIEDAKTDPILVQLIMTQPEIVVGVEHRKVELLEETLKGRLAKLAARGFFKDPKSQADTNRELKRTGNEAHAGRLSEAFQTLVVDGILTREESGFQLAPGVKVTERALTT